MLSLQIELTNHCNYQCHNCPHSKSLLTRPRGYMSSETFGKIVEQGYKHAHLFNFSFFGEPLLHPRFLEFTARIKNRPSKVQWVLNSNLSLATKETFSKLINYRLNNFRISVDASSSETYDVVRPSSSCLDLDGNKVSKEDRFKAIEEKIRYWFALKKHVPTRHVFVASDINKHEIQAYVKKWKSLLSPKDEILVKSVLSYGGKLLTDPLIIKRKCNVWGLRLITIDWQGNVSPCNLDTNMDLIVGNINNATLPQILKSKKYREVKRRSQERKMFPCDKCVDSNNWSKNTTFKKNTPWNPKILNKFKIIRG